MQKEHEHVCRYVLYTCDKPVELFAELKTKPKKLAGNVISAIVKGFVIRLLKLITIIHIYVNVQLSLLKEIKKVCTRLRFSIVIMVP